MANTLTALQPVLFAAARIVPRELTGLIGSSQTDFDDKGVALGDTLTIPVVPTPVVGSYTPAQNPAEGTSRTVTSKVLTLSQAKEVSWHLTAEQERSLLNGGNAQEVFRQTVEQSIRALINSMEAYGAGIAKANASRAVGTAGTTPFGSNLNDLTAARKILRDNGVPDSDLSAVIDTAAEMNLSNLTQLQKVNESGSPDTLRMGVIGSLFKVAIAPSGNLALHTKGTGASYLVNSASLAIGDTTIPVDTGSGTILAGDVLAFAGDSNKYVVKTALSGGNVVIQEPGLRTAVADNSAVTVENGYTGNLVLHKSALTFIARPAIQPVGARFEQMVIADPKTGLSFLLVRDVGYGQVSYHLSVVYDVASFNPFAMALLRG